VAAVQLAARASKNMVHVTPSAAACGLGGLRSQVHTVQVTPTHPDCDKVCGNPAVDQPHALQQWLNAVEEEPSLQKAPWILLIETDYIWMRPLQVECGGREGRGGTGWMAG
jgi:hypothetical protein